MQVTESNVAVVGLLVFGLSTAIVPAPAPVSARQDDIAFVRNVTEATPRDPQTLTVRLPAASSPDVVESVTTPSATPREEVTRLMAKVAELSSIVDGTLAPGSIGVKPEVLLDLQALGSLADHVHAVPTFSGSVAIEWQIDTVEYTAKIEPAHRLFMCVDDIDADDVVETTVDFSATVLQRFIETGVWEV